MCALPKDEGAFDQIKFDAEVERKLNEEITKRLREKSAKGLPRTIYGVPKDTKVIINPGDFIPGEFDGFKKTTLGDGSIIKGLMSEMYKGLGIPERIFDGQVREEHKEMVRAKPKVERLRSLDTETTGIDFFHGAEPYLVTMCDMDEEPLFWEADVDPLTRKVLWKNEDKEEIKEYSMETDLVMQNPKFDVKALEVIGIEANWVGYDTLMAGHLLASNHAHDLTSMALEYLGIDIEPYEDALEVACTEARRMAASKWPEWLTARVGLPCMPSIRGGLWKVDGWLPRRIAQELNYPDDHPWWSVLSNYACGDSAVTLPLFLKQKELMIERGLWEIYLCRMKLVPVIYEMEHGGVTKSATRTKELRDEFTEEAATAERKCLNIAKSFGYDLELPKSGSNKSLTTFIFDVMKLPVTKKTKGGSPCLDKRVMDEYVVTLPENSKELSFIKALQGKRKRDTALAYMDGYDRFEIEIKPTRQMYGSGKSYIKTKKETGLHDWRVLFPSLNATGTDTLRFSSSNPNEQNIGKQSGAEWPELSRSLRYLFGPLPGRVWYSFDYSNLELYIPAYASGEQAMIELFEKPDEPPYFGSYHMLIFDVLHPDKFKQHGMKCKDVYKSTWYQWTKNGNFAVTYGAVEKSGTADRAYHVPGAQALIQKRFGKLTELNNEKIALAEKQGYVETMPDKTVDPKHGYPLLCTRSKWGGIQPTVPLNYFVQGTAMWCTCKAMLRVSEYLKKLQRTMDKYDGRLVLQVHDELVIDLPKNEPTRTGYVITEVQKLMEQSGDDIGIPLRTSVTRHDDNWSEGVTVDTRK